MPGENGRRAADVRLAAPFVDHLRREAFSLGAGPRSERMGAEVELIPVDLATGRVAVIEGPGGRGTLAALRGLARRLPGRGWSEHRSAKAGVPELRAADGGRITFEPGGQIEYAAPANESVSGLLSDLRDVAAALEDCLAPAGIGLVSLGIDPTNHLDDVPLLLEGERYRRMDAHFASIGRHGAMMMRQTASIQVCVDAGGLPLARWRLLNALAPYLVAIFANSPLYAGAATGHQSTRRFVWGALDPARTGLPYDEADPVGGYARFALAAPPILLGPADDAAGGNGAPASRGPVSFAGHLASYPLGLDDWRAHLSTLFPEVRPRGYFEVRSADALEPRWYAAPLAFIAGLVWDERAARAAAEIAGAPDPLLLAPAGRCALTDARLAGAARDLTTLALAGCESLGTGVIGERDLDAARSFFERYTWRARSPASDAMEAVAV